MALDLMVICMTLSRKDLKIRELEIMVPGDLDLMDISMILSGDKLRLLVITVTKAFYIFRLSV